MRTLFLAVLFSISPLSHLLASEEDNTFNLIVSPIVPAAPDQHAVIRNNSDQSVMVGFVEKSYGVRERKQIQPKGELSVPFYDRVRILDKNNHTYPVEQSSKYAINYKDKCECFEFLETR